MKRVGVRIAFETLEARDVPNAAFDLIHLSGTGGARGDARFSAVDGSGGGTTKQSVVIIDTGLDQTHPLLSGNFEVGFDFFGPDARRDGATVTGDHGTHVSGTVGSTDPEIGVANGVGLIGLNVFGATQDGLRAPNNDIEEALRWVIDNKATYNIVAVNMSLGGGRFESLTADAKNSQLTDEITQLESQGVVVVTAAGNNYKRQNGNEVGQLSSPAIVSTIAVGSVWQDGVNSGVQWGSGATDNTTAPDQIVSHSNRLRAGSLGGTDYVDTLFAPGAIINSTVPGGGIEGMAGTSMASPHIAGIVALVQDAATRFLGHQLGALQVRDILFNTADTVSDTDTDNHDNVVNTGLTYRRVNVERALAFVFDQKAQLPTPPPPIPPGQTPPPPPETGTDPNGTIYGAVSSNFTLEAPVTIQGNLGTDYGVPVGSASTFGDVDIFRFVVAPGQDNTPIRIDVAGVADANFDTYLRVFDQAGTEISVNDDVGSGKLYSSLSVTLPAGTYYAGVSAYPNYNYNPFIAGSGSQAPSGTYSINFQSDLVDPNGTRYSAVPLFQDANGRFQSVDENIGLDYGVGYDKFAKPLTVRSDVDMYALVAPDDGTITFDVLAFRGGVQPNIPGGLPDSYLRVWRNYVAVDTTDGSAAPADYAFNDDIDFSIRNFDSRIVQFPVHAGDLIHIGVSGFGNGHYNPDSLENRLSDVNTGNYRLSATFDSTDLNGYIETVDDHNINTGATNATRLTNDPDLFIYQQRGNIGIDRFADANGQPQESKSGQDVDLVQFTFPATFSNGSTTAVFQFALESFGVNFAGVPGIENPVDGIVTLFNAAGEPLAQIDDTYDDKGNFLSLDPTLSYTVEAGQTYYVGISGYSNFGYNPHFAGSGSSGSTGDYLFTAEVISLGEVRGKTDNKAGKSNPSIILGETIAGRIGSDSVAATLNNKAAGTTTAIQSTLNDPDTQDVDFRRFTATGTGIMDVRVLAFEDFNASNGTIRVFRSNADMTPGDVIPSTLVDIGPISGGAVRFRATNGETYFIGVTGKAFQASGSFDGKTTIPLSPADRNNPNVVLDAGGYNLSVNALPTLDADGDGTAGGSNDAILLSRYVNGLEAEVLADGITFGAGATRRTGEAIAAYFDGFANVRNMAFDGNGDGKGGGSDDAILARRFVNGLESEVLSDGITFGILAQRRAGSDVAEYFMPLTNTGGAGGRVAAPGGHTPAGRVRIAGPQLSAADDTPPAITAPGVAMWSAPADAAGTPAGLTSGDGTGEQAAADTTTPAAAAAPGDDDHAEPTLADLPADAVWLQGVFVG